MTALALVAVASLLVYVGYCRITQRPGLFGPLTWLEVRKAGRLWYVRGATVLCAAALSVMVGVIYIDHVIFPNYYLKPGRVLNHAAILMLAAWGQVLAWVTAVVATIWVAWPIARWKEQRTLDLLLTTDLRDREIVGGLTAGRAAVPLRLLLAGVPIGVAIHMLAGVDAEILFATAAAVAVTILSLCSLATACAVVGRRPVGSIVLTWAAAGGYLLATGILSTQRVGSTSYHSADLFGWTISIGDIADVLSAGNPFVAVENLVWDKGWRASLNWRLSAYLWHHVLLTVGLYLFAVWRLRPAAGQVGVPRPPRRLFGRWRVQRRPTVTDQPMRWKEVYVQRGLRLPWYAKLAVLAVVLLSFLPLGVMLADAPHYSTVDLRLEIMLWSRIAGSLVMVLVLFGVVVRAALAVDEERSKDTFVSLALTPLSSHEIVRAKWWVCLTGMKWGWIWVGLLWLPGVIAAGPMGIALSPLLLLAAATWAALAAWTGVFVASVGRSGWQSILAAIGLWVGPPALPIGVGYVLVQIWRALGDVPTGRSVGAVYFGMCWPVGLGVLPPIDYRDVGASYNVHGHLLRMAIGALFSLPVAWLLIRRLAHRAVARFDRLRTTTQ